MTDYRYRILNVFAEEHRLSGNPLAVVEDARGLDDATMQAIALQFNLSETTFVLPSTVATTKVRIFTPTFEMPFAGHPTLGTAHVVRSLLKAGDAVTLEMRAGVIPVRAQADEWTLEAKAQRHRAVDASHEQLATMLGLSASDIGTDPLWVDTGSEQLVIPLQSADAVARCRPDSALVVRYGSVPGGAAGRALAYVWAPSSTTAVIARFFFSKHGAVLEDPGTGSACANLGGWLIATGAKLPRTWIVSQGAAVGRPCRLGLTVDADRRIFVSGAVIELGHGVISI